MSCVAFAHAPWLQTRAEKKLPLLHIAAPHGVPFGQRSHWPAPSQNPSWLHVAGSMASHSLSGSVPALMGAQVPFAPPVFAAEQAKHRPGQPVLQHTPSTQALLLHSLPPAHVAPLAFLAVQLRVAVRQ